MIQTVVCQFNGILLIGLGSSQAIVTIVMYQYCIDNGNIKSGILERKRNRRMVITRSFHDDTGFTDQAFECFYQFTQLTGGVLYFKGCEYNFSKGAHDRNHALPFGYINTDTIHLHTSQ